MTVPGTNKSPKSLRASTDPSGPRASTDSEWLNPEILRAAESFIGANRVLERFGEYKTLEDATSKFLIRDHAQEAEWVLLLSSRGGPEIIARGVQRARKIAALLGEELGRAVLLPAFEGDVDGRTFAIFPYCTPLLGSGPAWWIQRSVVRTRMIRWLVESSRRTVTAIPEAQLQARVYEPLEHMLADANYSTGMRSLAEEASRAALAGTWEPRHVFMHDDLWVGNVLIDQRSTGGSTFGRPVIIDWAGSRACGYPMYDFLRLSVSFGLTGRPFARALDRYCAAIGYTRSEGNYAFAHAVAELGQRLEHWPRTSYLSTIERCYQRLMHES